MLRYCEKTKEQPHRYTGHLNDRLIYAAYNEEAMEEEQEEDEEEEDDADDDVDYE